jgi:hypothetical protein
MFFAQPTGGEIRGRHKKFAPTAIKTDQDIRGRIHGRMAEGTRTIAIKANLGWNDGERFGRALRARHNAPL